MTEYLRNPLTRVWATLTAITVLSWWLGRGQGVEYEPGATITYGVLIMATVKALLVIGYFMEVRFAPAWLKSITYGWAVGLLLLLLLSYSLMI